MRGKGNSLEFRNSDKEMNFCMNNIQLGIFNSWITISYMIISPVSVTLILHKSMQTSTDDALQFSKCETWNLFCNLTDLSKNRM